jgi:DNA-binding LacI/PurR family transcriptional regulator
MARIRDVAELAGVSAASVSIYLKDSDTTRVSPATKRRIDDAISELDFRPNLFARGLSTQKSGIVLVMIPYNGNLFASQFLNQVFSGIREVLFPAGMSMLFLPTAGENSPSVVRNQLRQGRVYDGIIICGTRYCSYEDHLKNVDQLLRSGTPFSTVNVPEVEAQINQAILTVPIERAPVKYLFDLGHRRVLLVSGREGDIYSDQFEKHFLAFSEMHGVEHAQESIAYGDFEREVARSAVYEALQHDPSYTAVQALSDTMAAGAYSALRDLSLSVPGDVSVLGTNDMPLASDLEPALTTFHRPIWEAGAEAARSLLRTIQTGNSGRKVRFSGELVLRDSVSAPRTAAVRI